MKRLIRLIICTLFIICLLAGCRSGAGKNGKAAETGETVETGEAVEAGKAGEAGEAGNVLNGSFAGESTAVNSDHNGPEQTAAESVASIPETSSACEETSEFLSGGDGAKLSLSSVSDHRKELIDDIGIWNGKWYLNGDKDGDFIHIEDGTVMFSGDAGELSGLSGKITASLRNETHSYNNMEVDSESLILSVCGENGITELMNVCGGCVLLLRENGLLFFHESICEEGELSEIYPSAVLVSKSFEQAMRNDKVSFLPEGLLVLAGYDTSKQCFEENAAGIWSAETSVITVKYFDGTEETFEPDFYTEPVRFYLDHTASDYYG